MTETEDFCVTDDSWSSYYPMERACVCTARRNAPCSSASSTSHPSDDRAARRREGWFVAGATDMRKYVLTIVMHFMSLVDGIGVNGFKRIALQ